jgi:hypothetical protein
MEFKRRTLNQVADLICGNFANDETFFVYRSSKYLTEFFEDIETGYRHDGSTRQWWVATALTEILTEPQPSPSTPPDTFARVIQRLMDQEEAIHEGSDRPGALTLLNASLAREGFEAFYADDRQCYLRHIATNNAGPRAAPSLASTSVPASAAHSPMAANDLSPAITAAIPTASSPASACRRPRFLRGSGTWASRSRRYWLRAAGVDEDVIGGRESLVAGDGERRNFHRSARALPAARRHTGGITCR